METIISVNEIENIFKMNKFDAIVKLHKSFKIDLIDAKRIMETLDYVKATEMIKSKGIKIVSESEMKMIVALENFKKATMELNRAFDAADVDCNYYISEYPKGWADFSEETLKVMTFVDETLINLRK